ncbi:AIM24 family protein [Alicyclobacillus herbarius]|uniref:AIM24 family protein n=1 Tax=Alicyclobacillus herbarius TaxID=122960 RepID=UPI0023541AAE|nr:AIM24 family protein [Alicyclobacillus herbarius]
MDYRIEGSTMQTLVISLRRGEAVYSETGCLLMMTDGIRMSTKGGGLGQMLARGLSGNSLFLNVFEAMDDDEEVMFTTRLPGHILALDMRQMYEVVLQRHAFLCAEDGVDYQTAFTLKTGRLMGGNGLVFNTVRGEGMAFVSIRWGSGGAHASSRGIHSRPPRSHRRLPWLH